jgi:hypothetical protein
LKSTQAIYLAKYLNAGAMAGAIIGGDNSNAQEGVVMHLKRSAPMTSCAEMQFINTLELAAMRGAVPDSQRELAAEVVEQ